MSQPDEFYYHLLEKSMGPSDKEDSDTGLQVEDSTSIVKRLKTAVTAPVSSKAFHRLQTVSSPLPYSTQRQLTIPC